jgi:bifunctional NMN adenylyltransferase/nudix hydrolase
MTLPTPTDVGVVIGRFQVPQFHKGHRALLDMVSARHQRVLVLLGSPAWRGGKKDPLDYATRVQMFATEYPQFITAAITDCQTDEAWSVKVDEKIKEIFPLARITLYGGSNDSFIKQYSGHHICIRVYEITKDSGTILRENSAALPSPSEFFRTGVIYGILNNPGRMAPCVDGAVLRRKSFASNPEVILIQKPGEKLWRFPGGKLEPSDDSLEAAVNREVREETGLEVGQPVYVASGNLPDWRAVGAGITIHSSLFALPYIFGAPVGGDDAALAQWFDLYTLKTDHMEKCHKVLLMKLQEWAVYHEEEFFNVKSAFTN